MDQKQRQNLYLLEKAFDVVDTMAVDGVQSPVPVLRERVNVALSRSMSGDVTNSDQIHALNEDVSAFVTTHMVC